MIPAEYNITIYQGDDYDLVFRLKDGAGAYMSLTGWTPSAQIRETEDSNTVLATFAAVLADQTTSPGGVVLALTPEQTAELTEYGGVWDVQLTNADMTEVRTYLRGTVTVLKQVTR